MTTGSSQLGDRLAHVALVASTSLGVANGDLLSSIIAFSPGFYLPPGHRGNPRIFVSHGTGDTVLPYEVTLLSIVPALRNTGYAVEFVGFPGGHVVPFIVGEQAFAWFAGSAVGPGKAPDSASYGRYGAPLAGA